MATAVPYDKIVQCVKSNVHIPLFFSGHGHHDKSYPIVSRTQSTVDGSRNLLVCFELLPCWHSMIAAIGSILSRTIVGLPTSATSLHCE